MGASWVIAAKMDATIPPGGATPAALPAAPRDTGKCQDQPPLRRHRRIRGWRQPRTGDASHIGPDPRNGDGGTYLTPAMPNKKEKRSDCSCVSGTTAPATEVSMS